MIKKVGNGIYIDSSKIEDSYFVFSLELSNIVYSHMTVLYFHGLSIKAPMGNNVRVYDVERCICDIIRSKNRMDKEHVKYSIKEYNKYLLSLIGIFVLLLTGIISYNYTNTSLKELIQNIQEEN